MKVHPEAAWAGDSYGQTSRIIHDAAAACGLVLEDQDRQALANAIMICRAHVAAYRAAPPDRLDTARAAQQALARLNRRVDNLDAAAADLLAAHGDRLDAALALTNSTRAHDYIALAPVALDALTRCTAQHRLPASRKTPAARTGLWLDKIAADPLTPSLHAALESRRLPVWANTLCGWLAALPDFRAALEAVSVRIEAGGLAEYGDSGRQTLTAAAPLMEVARRTYIAAGGDEHLSKSARAFIMEVLKAGGIEPDAHDLDNIIQRVRRATAK